MLTPSPDILPWLSVLAAAFSAPTYQNMLTLLCGTILTPGARTVTAALRVLGWEQGNFSKYHRCFNRARWSPLRLSHLLFSLLLHWFIPPGQPLQILVDEHLERRQSRKLAYRGLFRDPIRSTAQQVQFSWGIRWLCFCLLCPVPWSQRPWALPFLILPLLSEKACQRLKKPHTTLIEQTARALGHLRRWVPERELVLVGDGSYAAVPLILACQQGARPTRLISRLRLDAALYDFPEPPPAGKRGRKAKKGARQPKLAARLLDPTQPWQRLHLCWYGGEEIELEYLTGVSLWYRPQQPPVPLRWVLVRSPEGTPHPIEPGAVFCSDPETPVAAILTGFVGRWNIEVTFAEIRAHLGLETQRHWSRLATGRVTPCLFGLFSLVVVLAKALHGEKLPVRQSNWYQKEEATFADALAAVRGYLWSALAGGGQAGPNNVNSPESDDPILIPGSLWRQLQQVLCYAP
jgi:hypothetical protein